MLIIGSMFYIPVLTHLFSVSSPTELEPGDTDPPTDPYLYTIRDIIRDPIIGFFDIIDITIIALLALLLIPALA